MPVTVKREAGLVLGVSILVESDDRNSGVFVGALSKDGTVTVAGSTGGSARQVTIVAPPRTPVTALNCAGFSDPTPAARRAETPKGARARG